MNMFRPVLLLLVLALMLACNRDGAVPASETAASAEMSHADAETRAQPELDRFEWPSLSLDTVTGERYDMAAYRGQWVVVNFWATWCAPCRKEMPELSALHARRGDISVVGLAYEEIEPEALRAFLAEYPVSYPVAIIDVAHPPPDFAVPRGLPTTYLIAPDGQVARQFLGPVSAEDIERLVAQSGD